MIAKVTTPFSLFYNREYFRLLMCSLAENNSPFCGMEFQRTATHNMALLQRKEFFFVGQCIALSLLYGGPGPHFFCETAANYLLDLPFPSSSKIASEVPDYEISEKIKQVKQCMKV